MNEMHAYHYFMWKVPHPTRPTWGSHHLNNLSHLTIPPQTSLWYPNPPIVIT